MNDDTRDTLDQMFERAHDREYMQSKARQKQKLQRLLQKKPDRETHMDLSGTQLKKWVINLSKRELSKAETTVLARGLNFAVTPDRLPVNDVIVQTEKACGLIPAEERDKLRAEVCGALKSARMSTSNISKEERAAVRNIGKDTSIMILPADKGKATVVMDKKDYEKKVKDMLSDERTYLKLDNDPTLKYRKKLVSILDKMRSEKKITTKQYQHLNPASENQNIPRMYCTPKIHKTGNPLRPIVDYTGSIGYNISRALADLLAPLVGKTKYHVQNSKQLAGEMKEVQLEEDDMFVSHDVVSLFTNTPIPQSIEIISNKLKKDKTLKKRTLLALEDIVELLEFVLITTYFMFRGQVYQQKFGTAMGSPVSPIVANLFMEDLEQRAMESASAELRPTLWKRYVDDTLEVIKRGKVDAWSAHLNNMDPTGSIKFTHEIEADNTIAFLDTLLERKEDGSVKVKVFRKKTHTNQYLAFDSHHPLHQKLGVPRTLLNRCDEIVTEEEDRKEERNTIKNALNICGYPDRTIKRVEEKLRNKEETKGKGNSRKESREKNKGMVVLPYVRGVSEELARIYKKRQITSAMKPHSTLRTLLVHPKTRLTQKKAFIP